MLMLHTTRKRRSPTFTGSKQEMDSSQSKRVNRHININNNNTTISISPLHIPFHNEVKLHVLGLQWMYGAGGEGVGGAEYFAHAQPFSPGRCWTVGFVSRANQNKEANCTDLAFTTNPK